MRDVIITAVLNGWTVRVGCQTLVYNKRQTLLRDLEDYMVDSKAKEKTFLKCAINRRMVTEGCPQAGPPAPQVPCPPPIGAPVTAMEINADLSARADRRQQGVNNHE